MSLRAFSLALLAVAAVPSAAAADPLWTTPATLSGGTAYDAPVIYTPHGHGVVAAPKSGSSSSASTVVATLHSDGTPGTSRTAALFSAQLAAYANDHYVVAGPKAGTSSSKAPVQYLTASPGDKLPSPKTLSDTEGQRLFDVAGNANGTIAFVTGTTSGTMRRYVWIRKGGSVKKALTIRAGSRARGASVAVGKHDDVLVAWEDGGQINSRHIGPSGNVASQHTLGDGVQSNIETSYDDSGRQEVAWESQRVGEGDAASPATVSYTSAAKGSGFTKAKVVGTSSLTGTGNYVAAPGVRLVTSGSDSGVLAFTIYDGAHFRVQVVNVAAGTVQPPVTVSPDGQDCVLGDLAYARAGGTLVLWRSGTRGHDANGPQRVFASWRPAGQADFGAPEAVSAEQVPESPFAAVNPSNGMAVAAWGYLSGPVAVSARPASGG